jgi:hypothetical protein
MSLLPQVIMTDEAVAEQVICEDMHAVSPVIAKVFRSAEVNVTLDPLRTVTSMLLVFTVKDCTLSVEAMV